MLASVHVYQFPLLDQNFSAVCHGSSNAFNSSKQVLLSPVVLESQDLSSIPAIALSCYGTHHTDTYEVLGHGFFKIPMYEDSHSISFAHLT